MVLPFTIMIGDIDNFVIVICLFKRVFFNFFCYFGLSRILAGTFPYWLE